MSTPMNPNQPQGGAHYPPQQQPATAGAPHMQAQGGQPAPQQGSAAPVSYTHLTLPTILRV